MAPFSNEIGPGGRFSGPKLFPPESYPTYASAKLCEFIIPMMLYTFNKLSFHPVLVAMK